MLTNYHAIRALMHQRWPSVFTARGTAPRPLRLGVYDEIAAAVLDQVAELSGDGKAERHLRDFMAKWTGRPEYQTVVAVGGPRHGLDSDIVGEISAAEQSAAAEHLAGLGRRPALSKQAGKRANWSPEKRAADNRRHSKRRKKLDAEARMLYMDSPTRRGDAPCPKTRRNRKARWMFGRTPRSRWIEMARRLRQEPAPDINL